MAAPVAMPPGRVPCPWCRGPVHPIASRCRHCHSELPRGAIVSTATPPRRPARAALIAMAVLAAAAALALPLLIA